MDDRIARALYYSLREIQHRSVREEWSWDRTQAAQHGVMIVLGNFGYLHQELMFWILEHFDELVAADRFLNP